MTQIMAIIAEATNMWHYWRMFVNNKDCIRSQPLTNGWFPRIGQLDVDGPCCLCRYDLLQFDDVGERDGGLVRQRGRVVDDT